MKKLIRERCEEYLKNIMNFREKILKHSGKYKQIWIKFCLLHEENLREVCVKHQKNSKEIWKKLRAAQEKFVKNIWKSGKF